MTQETVQISQTSVTTDTDELGIDKVPSHHIDLYNRSIEFLDQGQHMQMYSPRVSLTLVISLHWNTLLTLIMLDQLNIE